MKDLFERAADVKAMIAISSVVGERVQLKRDGKFFRGCCPFHDDSTPSFWVDDQSGRFGCFGCNASGDLIDFVMEYEACSFRMAIEQLEEGHALSPWPSCQPHRPNRDLEQRIAAARSIWEQAEPIQHTPAELYLANRSLRLADLPDLGSLRFARLPFERSARLHPTLVAAVETSNGEFAGVQRTYLTEDGRKLEVHNAKRSLGALKGNAIRIGDKFDAHDQVIICEGLEDGLSLSRIPGSSTELDNGLHAFRSDCGFEPSKAGHHSSGIMRDEKRNLFACFREVIKLLNGRQTSMNSFPDIANLILLLRRE